MCETYAIQAILCYKAQTCKSCSVAKITSQTVRLTTNTTHSVMSPALYRGTLKRREPILLHKVSLPLSVSLIHSCCCHLPGPTELTVSRFWQMVWDYQVPTIVMLTHCVEDGKVCLKPFIPGLTGGVDNACTYARIYVSLGDYSCSTMHWV